MHIGNRMYNIGNLVATSIGTRHVGFQGGPLKAVWSKKRRFLLIAVGLLILGSIEDPTGAVYLGEAALVALAAVTVAQIVRMLRERRTDYVLQLETSGSITGIVASPDPDAIHKLAKLVADATNNPPVETVHMNVNHGTIIHQHGDQNVGQQYNEQPGPQATY